MEDALTLQNLAIGQIMDAQTTFEIERIEIDYLGRNGRINALTKQIKDLPKEDRGQAGFLINQAKQTIFAALNDARLKLELETQKIDTTIPGIKPPIGHKHLVTQAIEEISDVFEKIGFVRRRYPEVEWDWYAFEALNMESSHPARDEWETYFVDQPDNKKYGSMVLTPHTSSGQVREMEKGILPIRMINIGKCYRRQSDVSHVPMFHQFEGLVVDKNITIANLKGTLDYFAKNFFGEKRVTRLRPYHFQFTEPSFEVDISCGYCDGKGCKLCKAGWLELGGAGMVHPNVFKSCKIDPGVYSGFAFGWGVERTFMMKSGISIPDVRLLYSADLNFLRQF